MCIENLFGIICEITAVVYKICLIRTIIEVQSNFLLKLVSSSKLNASWEISWTWCADVGRGFLDSFGLIRRTTFIALSFDYFQFFFILIMIIFNLAQ